MVIDGKFLRKYLYLRLLPRYLQLRRAESFEMHAAFDSIHAVFVLYRCDAKFHFILFLYFDLYTIKRAGMLLLLLFSLNAHPLGEFNAFFCTSIKYLNILQTNNKLRTLDTKANRLIDEQEVGSVWHSLLENLKINPSSNGHCLISSLIVYRIHYKVISAKQ